MLKNYEFEAEGTPEEVKKKEIAPSRPKISPIPKKG
jgi:hypothetical protein